MATPEVMDLESLLQPISEEAPAGIELKEDATLSPLYYQIKDAREAARTAERQAAQAAWLGDEDVTIESPRWDQVLESASIILREHSKDLWIAAWAVEAMTRLYGFRGVRDGFRLTRELAERYWDDIHPRPDEDGVATTVAQLTGLNGDESEGALIAPLEKIPITAGGSIDPLTSADYKDAVDLEQTSDPDRRAQRIEEGVVTLDEFDRAVAESSPEFYQTTLEDVEQALKEFSQLNEILEEKCGNTPDGYPAAPPTSAIRQALEECADRIRSIAKDLLATEDDVEDEESGDLVSAEGGVAVSPKKGMTREDAFRALLQVADYFRRTEPHSPVSYALEQAVRWGRMSLPELLSELVADGSARDEIFRRTGIQQPGEPDE